MINGKKVRFRAIEEHDLPSLAEWLNDPELGSLVVGAGFPVSMAQQKAWFARQSDQSTTQRWIVETHEGQVIGLTGLWDIDWRNRHALTALKLGSKDTRGKGYGSDAILAVMSYAFLQLGLERLWGEILPYNIGSYKAYVDHCGWKVEGILRRHVYRDGKYWDLVRVAALKEDFMMLPHAADYLPAEKNTRLLIAPEHLGRTEFGALSIPEQVKR